jgi:hypothetical protein
VESTVTTAIDSKDLIGGFHLKLTKGFASLWKDPSHSIPNVLMEEDVTLMVDRFEIGAN